MRLFSGKIINFWPYRKAIVLDSSFKIDLDPFGRKNVKFYVEEQGYHFDNHIVFQMENGLYVWFTDNRICIGTKIEEGDW